MSKVNRRRVEQYTCYCPAYSFPHRIFSGKCTQYDFVSEYWHRYYGAGVSARDVRAMSSKTHESVRLLVAQNVHNNVRLCSPLCTHTV